MMLITETTPEITESSPREVPDQERGCDPIRRSSSCFRSGKADRQGRTGHQSKQPLTLATAAKEYIWLYDFRHGIGINEIAARDGVSMRRVYDGLERARAMDKKPSRDAQTGLSSLDVDITHVPRLIPLFPIGSYTPQSACPHLEPIEQGSALCCMVCHGSGMDAHPSLRRDPRMDPAPEPKAEPTPNFVLQPKTGESHETRKQRRRRMFALQAATAAGSSDKRGADQVRPS
jgi:hypothetical protein